MVLTRRAIGALAASAAFIKPGLALAQVAAPRRQFLSLATSSVGGSWYPLGSAMATVISRHYPMLNVNTEVTGGTNDNLNLLRSRRVDLALSTTDQAYMAMNGRGAFQGNPVTTFKGLIGGHMIIWHLYTLRRTGITSIGDLRGKRVSLGGAGSIGNEIGQIVLEAHGLKMNQDWRPEYLGHADGTGALKDGRVDAVINITAAPTGAITDITSTDGANVVFINPDPSVLDRLLKDHPYWSRTVLPGGAYRGHDRDLPGSFGVATILVAGDRLDNSTTYAITKALLDNQRELSAAHALGREWTTQTATRGIKGVIPFHPGAEQFLKERGLL